MANTRKLHYKDINATASTYTGDLGNIWFDPETNVLRTYTGSPGGKLIGDGTGAASTTGTFAAGTLAGSYYSLYNDGVGYDTYISSKNNDGEVGILSHESAFIKTSWNDADKTWTFGTDGTLTLPPGGVITGIGQLNLNSGGYTTVQSIGFAVDNPSSKLLIQSGPFQNLVLKTNGLYDWNFGTDGTLTLPKGLQTSSSETLNLFTNYSSGNINIGGISPTINMGSGQVNIGYLNTRIVFGYSGVLTAGTSFTNFTGTPASNGMWTTAIATGTNGNGGPQNGVPVSFTVHGSFGVYNSVSPNFYDQGQNYAVGDTITIAGTQLGGTSPANDLTFTIAGEVGDTYPNLGPGSLVFDYGLGQFFGYTQNTYGTQAYPLWRRLDNTSASSLVNGSYTVSLGTAGTLNLPNFGSTPGAGDGSIGDIARDGDILYFKTSTGWKTVTLGV